MHKRDRATLGFLPFAGFEQRAASGTLLGCLDGEDLVGYALYDLPFDFVALRELCVARQHRGRGVARRLVEAIHEHHPERRGIRLRCRRDFPAARMWEHLDFEPLRDRRGRSTAGHLLTIWWRDFGHPTLFSPQESERRRVAIDTDVFLDLFDERPGGAESRKLLSDWVADELELCATKELTQELNKHPDPNVRERRLADVRLLRTTDARETAWRATEKALLKALAPETPTGHDEHDVRHLARAAAAGFEIFVTRDRRLRDRLGSKARELLGIEVLTPAQLVRRIWANRTGDYSPAALEATTFTSESVKPDDVDAVAAFFLDRSGGERLSVFRSRLRPLLASPDRWLAELTRDAAGEMVALVISATSDDCMRVPVLRVAGPMASTIARHAVHALRKAAASTRPMSITVDEPRLALPVRSALMRESFVEAGESWTGMVVPACAPATRLSEDLLELAPAASDPLGVRLASSTLKGGVPEATIATELERRFWPMKIADAPLPTFVVPIAAAFAEKLFETRLSEETLFPRPDHLGMSCEHVYYRSPTGVAIEAPARLLWYVSSERNRPGTKAIRACSRLEEVDVDEADVLFHRYRHLGVWEYPDIAATAKRGRAMALRFTDTELFPTPVPLEDVRRCAARRGRKPFLQSSWKIDEHMFDKLYRAGWAGVR